MEADKLLKTEHCKKLYEKIITGPYGVAGKKGTMTLFKWFLWYCEFPHGSGHVEVVREALIAIGKKMGFNSRADATGNVLISKPASKGYESAPAALLQCHMDMVIAHDPKARASYDPLKDGVLPFVDEQGWLKAIGTSLGADDGIGVATCLAVLELTDLAHPKIDCLFTVDEETTMNGANGFDPKLLFPDSKYILNVDSEDGPILILGCAGGADLAISAPVMTQDAVADAYSLFTIEVGGFLGGHTGCQIQIGRCNALKALARCIARASKNVHLLSFIGGTVANAIPSAGSAEVAIKKVDADAFAKAVAAQFEVIRDEFKTIEPAKKLFIKITPQQYSEKSIKLTTEECSRKLLLFWINAPSNPLRMSPDMAGFVETSACFSISDMKRGAGIAEFRGMARTSRDSAWNELELLMEANAHLVNGSLKMDGYYPGWLPEPESNLARVSEAAHEKAVGSKCQVQSIHAGLECGIIMQRAHQMAGMNLQAISIGPIIESPHSTQERCLLSSANDFWAWVITILHDLTN